MKRELSVIPQKSSSWGGRAEAVVGRHVAMAHGLCDFCLILNLEFGFGCFGGIGEDLRGMSRPPHVTYRLLNRKSTNSFVE
jgi:hypothetical protein